jgi:hypothetical protein
MCVFRLIPAGDLDLINGSPYFIDGLPYIRQKLSARFNFFLGEWFLNQLEGVPYYRDVFVASPNLDVIASLFKRVILGCPGVLSLKTFAMAFDPEARALSFAFQAVVDGGVIVVTPEDEDFLVSVN